MFRQRAAHARKERVFRNWLRDLTANPPSGLLGANFAQHGGIRHHIRAIQKHSGLRIELAPPESVMQSLATGDLTQTFREAFFEFRPKGVRFLHSHVYPWFIQWCHHQKKHHGTTWIHTHHNWYYPEFGRGALEPWQQEFNEQFLFAIRHADVSLSVSRWQQSFLRDTYGLETQYLPNGVDVTICDRADAARCHRKTGLADFVLYVGRNDPVKNPADFVKLAINLPKQQFLMLGPALSNATLHDDWGVTVPANLKVMGEATHQETQDALAACAALVVTSKREGLPTLVLEAMTHGKPIVVPDEDGCLEAVGNGDFGFIYRQGDIDHLSAMTLAAIADRQRCKLARKRVLEEYDWRVVMGKLDRVYAAADLP